MAKATPRYSEDEVRETVKDAVHTFLTGRGNDEDEIGIAGISKLNAKDTYDRHRTQFDDLMGDISLFRKTVLDAYIKANAVGHLAQLNAMHQSNIANKQTTLDAGVLADESVVTLEEALVNIITSSVLGKLAEAKK